MLRTICCILLIALSYSVTAQHTAKKVVYLMGSQFELIAVHEDSANAIQATFLAEKEIRRLEEMISSWLPTSFTSRINDNAGIKPIQVPVELFQLIERSQKISDLTAGAFNLAFGAIYELYQFKNQEFKPPSHEEIATRLPLADYRNIILNREKKTVFLNKKGMKIGFGAIGKGFVAEKAKELLLEFGIENGCINSGGDLTAWGYNSEGEPWKIGLIDPSNPSKFIGYVPLVNAAIVTSGDYEKFFTHKGKKYSHIIDPRTGKPVTEVSSVSIICPTAELADGLATAVSVLGIEKGLDLLNKLQGIEGILIDRHGQIFKTKQVAFLDD